MTVLDHLLAVLLAVGLPAYAWWSWPRFVRRSDESGARPRAYWTNVAVQWPLTAMGAAAWITAGRPWGELGFAVEPRWPFWAALAVAVAAMAALTTQFLVLARTERGRAQLRGELDPVESFMPRDRRELRSFAALAVTAGICEEILYRGFLIWYVTRLTGTTPVGVAGAVVITSVVFGAAHLEQGPRNAARIFAFALVVGTLYVVSGSLWVVIPLHAYMDLAAGAVAVTVRRDEPGSAPA